MLSFIVGYTTFLSLMVLGLGHPGGNFAHDPQDPQRRDGDLEIIPAVDPGHGREIQRTPWPPVPHDQDLDDVIGDVERHIRERIRKEEGEKSPSDKPN